MTPSAAARPNALPPVSSTAWTRSTRLRGSSRSVSRVPGPPPRTSTPPTAPSAGASTTVVPVSHPSPTRCACPTRRSATSSRPLVGPGRRPVRSVSSVTGTAQEEPRGLGIDVRAPHDVGDLDVLVGLVRDPLAARPVDDGGEAGVTGEDGAVGGAGDTAVAGGLAGDGGVRRGERGHHRVVDGRVHRRAGGPHPRPVGGARGPPPR